MSIAAAIALGWLPASVIMAALWSLARRRGWIGFAPVGEPVIHMCPASAGDWVTRCCEVDPFGLPVSEPTTPDPELVTCPSWRGAR